MSWIQKREYNQKLSTMITLHSYIDQREEKREGVETAAIG